METSTDTIYIWMPPILRHAHEYRTIRTNNTTVLLSLKQFIGPVSCRLPLHKYKHYVMHHSNTNSEHCQVVLRLPFAYFIVINFNTIHMSREIFRASLYAKETVTAQFTANLLPVKTSNGLRPRLPRYLQALKH